jgi:DNA-binding PadR family transcriptional regulator
MVGGEKLEGRILKKMHERIIKNSIDIIILAELRNRPMSGYDVISFIHNKFRLLVSSDTVYSLLYSLERNGLIAEHGTKEKEYTNPQKKA